MDLDAILREGVVGGSAGRLAKRAKTAPASKAPASKAAKKKAANKAKHSGGGAEQLIQKQKFARRTRAVAKAGSSPWVALIPLVKKGAWGTTGQFSGPLRLWHGGLKALGCRLGVLVALDEARGVALFVLSYARAAGELLLVLVPVVSVHKVLLRCARANLAARAKRLALCRSNANELSASDFANCSYERADGRVVSGHVVVSKVPLRGLVVSTVRALLTNPLPYTLQLTYCTSSRSPGPAGRAGGSCAVEDAQRRQAAARGFLRGPKTSSRGGSSHRRADRAPR